MKHILVSALIIMAATAVLAQSESKAAPSKRSVEGQLIELEVGLLRRIVFDASSADTPSNFDYDCRSEEDY
jgi:hypothetical protein